ncbi:MAG TPA: hypothetical protein DHU96_21140 [Actinobacteria bacterium]|nr:hypothetical protein [Actinomycetota bacterium]
MTRESPFERGPRRELISPQAHVVIGDPDDPDDPGVPAPDALRRTTTALASHLGIAGGTDAARERERARERRDAYLARLPLRPGHPGFRQETMAERAARKRSENPRQPFVTGGDLGTVPGLTRGYLA